MKCGGCVSQLTPAMDKLENVESWSVNLESPEKILTVESQGASEAEIVETVKQAGFSAERVN